MSDARFLQIHSLHGYSAVLLNRDDSGLAKRITYGDAIRTRISSQCLKRHWRVADSAYALQRIDGATASVRSRETVTKRVIGPLEGAGHDSDAIKAISTAFQIAVYGEKGDKRSNRQPLLLGEPEIAYLAEETQKIARDHGNEAKAAGVAAAEWVKKSKANMRALRDNCAMPGGIAAALFGRMVTSDVEANIDAAVHVAHASTVHAAESESDYFTVVDDLQRAEEEAGADHIGETELTSGLFYGYVVLDRGTLLANLGGDAEIAGDVAARLVSLIATVSPGAKLGPTAPYGYASWMLVEAGDRQPRSLAEAFREPCRPATRTAAEKAAQHLEKVDAAYETGEERRLMSLEDAAMPGSVRLPSLNELARWSGAVVRTGSA
ncbi:MAG: type I-E CRISPR-associated protein Cas7/Cse4/CasC [Acidobacteria bacterium]|nr:type I-E CRISPR-associated protein Cas7/Cse4/CasC [Acidobacteriota bacterium]